MSNKAKLKQFLKNIFLPATKIIQYFYGRITSNHLILTNNIINIHIVGMVKTLIMPMEENFKKIVSKATNTSSRNLE